MVAGPAHVNDKLARDRHRNIAAEILLDKSERHIDAGGYAGRGPAFSFVDVNRLGIDGEVWKGARQIACRAPMRRYAFVFEDAGRGEQKRTRAN